MRGFNLAAVAAAGSMLALAAPAAANVGDITNLDASVATVAENAVAIEGTVSCAASLGYGVIAKVAQPASAVAENSASNGTAEGVGAFGPALQGEFGIGDDQPCDSDGTAFDVVVFANQGSQPFDPAGQTGFRVDAATTADNGDRGPGPIIGDLETVSGSGTGSTGGGGTGTPLDSLIAQCAATPLAPICQQLGADAGGTLDPGAVQDLVDQCAATPLAPICQQLGLDGSSGGDGDGGLLDPITDPLDPITDPLDPILGGLL